MTHIPDTVREEIEKPLALGAYYYSFKSTGNQSIDLILSAVARAGRLYHHTGEWDTKTKEESFTGENPIQWIQNAANDAARIIALSRDDGYARGVEDSAELVDEHARYLETLGSTKMRKIAQLIAEISPAIRALTNNKDTV